MCVSPPSRLCSEKCVCVERSDIQRFSFDQILFLSKSLVLIYFSCCSSSMHFFFQMVISAKRTSVYILCWFYSCKCKMENLIKKKKRKTCESVQLSVALQCECRGSNTRGSLHVMNNQAAGVCAACGSLLSQRLADASLNKNNNNEINK